MGDTFDVLSKLTELSEKLRLGSCKPNMSLVEESMSVDVAKIDSVSDDRLRKYMLALGQYLIMLKYEENLESSMCYSWKKALDARINQVLATHSGPAMGKTLKEKQAWVFSNDEQTKFLNEQYEVAEAKRLLIANMSNPVEQYINTIKKELDARDNDRKRHQ